MVTRQVAPGLDFDVHVVPAGVPIEGGVAGGDAVIAKRKILPKAALLHVVDVHPEGPRAPEGPVQPLGPHTAVHAFEQPRIHAGVVVAPEVPGVGELQARQRQAAAGDVFADVGAHPRQRAVAREVEAVKVVDQAQVRIAAHPSALRQAPLGIGPHTQLVQQEAIGAADDLAKRGCPLGAKTGRIGLPVIRRCTALLNRGKGQVVRLLRHQRLRRGQRLGLLQQPFGAVDVQLRQGQGVPCELQPEAAHRGRGQRVHDADGALDALLQVRRRIDLGHHQGLVVRLLDRLHLPTGEAVDFAGHIGPTRSGQGGRHLGAQGGQDRVEQFGHVGLA